MADDDDDVDPFDALMGIDAEEFAALLDVSPPGDDDDDDDDDGGGPLCRGGVPCVPLGSITPEEFREKFLLSRKPVIVQDPDGELVPMHLTPEYLRDTYGTLTVPLDVTGSEREDVALADFVRSILPDDEDQDVGTTGANEAEKVGDGEEVKEEEEEEEVEEVVSTVEVTTTTTATKAKVNQRRPRLDGSRRSSLRRKYLRNLQMTEWFPDEAASLRLPEMFGPNALHDRDAVPSCPDNWRRWFELFVCHPECAGFPFLHRDTCHVHAASMQICGRKRFTLFHPDDAPFLYPMGATGCRSAIPADSFGGAGIITMETLEKYPALAHAKRVTVDVKPGEILVVPADWWHTARCVGTVSSVSIAASFVDEIGVNDFNDAYAEFSMMQSLVKVGAGVIT